MLFTIVNCKVFLAPLRFATIPEALVLLKTIKPIALVSSDHPSSARTLLHIPFVNVPEPLYVLKLRFAKAEF